MIRVYQFGLRPPVEQQALVREQMLKAHRYRNDLVAIERGRRAAIRTLHDTAEVREAEAAVKAASKATRKEAMKVLNAARKVAREAAKDEIDRIGELDAAIRRDARAICGCYWGTYLGIEAAADQVRKMPLWDRDAVTPSDPRFQRWTGDSQVGVQFQGGITTADAFAATDTRVRITLEPDRFGREGYPHYGTLWLRVGSEGRNPIWAKWPIKLHRAIPDNAKWKWVRVSCRREGPYERWTCEITLDIPGEHPRTLDTSLRGAVAVELMWIDEGAKGIVAARWANDDGERGEIRVSPRIVGAIQKADSIRSIRDRLLNDFRPVLAESIHALSDAPAWLARDADTMPHWKSPERFHDLARRLRDAPNLSTLLLSEPLRAWVERDRHLWAYEACSRRQALRSRRDHYRVLAAQWSRRYATVILPDRDLSRVAQWGNDSDLRFIAAPSELASALKHAFNGADLAAWDESAESWAASAITQWKNRQTASAEKKSTHGKGGAWASRKAKKNSNATP